MIDNLLLTLAAIVGPSGLVSGDELRTRPASWSRSEEPCMAAVLARPRNTQEVSAVVAACHEAGIPIVPRGGCTGLVDGVICAANEIALSLERMTGIESIDPLAMTMIVRSGTTLESVQHAAQEHGLMFPLDLGARGSATIGGAIATNAGGLQVLRYGMMRDMVLGLEAVLADGTIVSSMRPLIKNNTGLDLKQLFVGTEGTLGIVTRAVLRLRPAPAGYATAMIACADVDEAARVLAAVQSGFQGRVSSFEGMWPDFYRLMTEPGRFTPPLTRDYGFYAIVEIECGDEDNARFLTVLEALMTDEVIVDAAIASSEEQRRSMWRIRESVELLRESGLRRGFDVSLPLPALKNYVAKAMRDIAQIDPKARAAAFGHIGDNNIHWSVTGFDDRVLDGRIDDAIYGPLEGLDGSVSAEHGIGLQKRDKLKLSRSANELAVMKTIKQALDPRSLLNPGKIFSS